jgi:hypothetical protein
MFPDTIYIRMIDGKVEYADDLPKDYDYEVVVIDDANWHYDYQKLWHGSTNKEYNFVWKKLGKIKEKTIKIVVCLGLLVAVINLPEDWNYEIIESEEE